MNLAQSRSYSRTPMTKSIIRPEFRSAAKEVWVSPAHGQVNVGRRGQLSSVLPLAFVRFSHSTPTTCLKTNCVPQASLTSISTPTNCSPPSSQPASVRVPNIAFWPVEMRLQQIWSKRFGISSILSKIGLSLLATASSSATRACKRWCKNASTIRATGQCLLKSSI